MSDVAAIPYAAHPLLTEPGDEGGLRFGAGLVGLTVVALIVAAAVLAAGAGIAAGAVMGAWALVVVIASPRAGIVMALTLQVWDVTLNPEQGTALVFYSPVRVIMLVAAASYLVRCLLGHRPDIVRLRGVTTLLAFFAVWTLLSVGWSGAFSSAWRASAKIIIQVLLVMAAADYLAEPKAIRQTLFLTMAGGATGGIYALLYGAVRSEEEFRLALGGLGINVFAISIGFAITAAMALVLIRRTALIVMAGVASLIAMTLVALRTGTRSVIAAVPLAVLAAGCVAYWRQIHKWLLLTAVLGGVLIGTFNWAVQTGFIRGSLRDRLLTVFSAETYTTNERWALWAEALRIYAEQPMGTGAGQEASAYLTRGRTGNLESHNTFLSILVEYSVIGLGLFSGAVLMLAWHAVGIPVPAARAAATLILVFTLFNAMKGSSHENRILWLPLTMVAAMIECEDRRRRAAEPVWDGGDG
ncbi:MAG: O-antigen ligase family protein [Phycisphaerales bacterium]|nr:MAG: O-antigen ligase family protein [Phycisphaerales bacterium]